MVREIIILGEWKLSCLLQGNVTRPGMDCDGLYLSSQVWYGIVLLCAEFTFYMTVDHDAIRLII